MRTIFGKDLATGSIDVTTTAADSYYSTQGPASVFNVTNEPPLDPGSECFVLIYPFTGSCTDEQIAALYDGSAVIENNVVVSPAGRPAQVLNSTTLARF